MDVFKRRVAIDGAEEMVDTIYASNWVIDPMESFHRLDFCSMNLMANLTPSQHEGSQIIHLCAKHQVLKFYLFSAPEPTYQVYWWCQLDIAHRIRIMIMTILEKVQSICELLSPVREKFFLSL